MCHEHRPSCTALFCRRAVRPEGGQNAGRQHALLQVLLPLKAPQRPLHGVHIRFEDLVIGGVSRAQDGWGLLGCLVSGRLGEAALQQLHDSPVGSSAAKVSLLSIPQHVSGVFTIFTDPLFRFASSITLQPVAKGVTSLPGDVTAAGAPHGLTTRSDSP